MAFLGRGFPGGSEVKESACNVGDPGSIPGVGKNPWRRKWQSTPVFLPGESHGQRSLVGYSPQDAKSQTRLSNFTFLGKTQPVHPKGDHSWVFIGRTDVEAETLILWPPDAKS